MKASSSDRAPSGETSRTQLREELQLRASIAGPLATAGARNLRSRSYTPWLGVEVLLAGPVPLGSTFGVDIVDRARPGLATAEAWVRRKTGGLCRDRAEWAMALVEALVKCGVSVEDVVRSTAVADGVRLPSADDGAPERLLQVRYGSLGSLRWVVCSSPGVLPLVGCAHLAGPRHGATATLTGIDVAAELGSALIHAALVRAVPTGEVGPAAPRSTRVRSGSGPHSRFERDAA